MPGGMEGEGPFLSLLERTTRHITWMGEGEGGVSRSMLRAAVAGRLCKAGRGVSE